MMADWSVAREIASDFPMLLAGGLKVENVREAIEKVQSVRRGCFERRERRAGLERIRSRLRTIY